MATAGDCVEAGLLHRVRIAIPAGRGEVRRIYAVPGAYEWMRDIVPKLQADGHVEGATSPDQQLLQLLVALACNGQPPMPQTIMEPNDQGVIEFRTHDLRLFGWFWRAHEVIIAQANTTSACKAHRLYAGYRNETARIRGTLSLDPPEFLLPRAKKDWFR